jgi:hypothetical protein
MKIKILPPINVRSLPQGRPGRDELSRLVKEALEKALAEDEKSRVAL